MSSEYVVVARRYRPKNFAELVGQNQVAQAIRNAIKTNRVGHAYLFTGARGVGKTSSARIFAKCLNCVEGPTSEPCGQCDPCLSIAAGEDVDVLEIDGASNRGIEEIRQLRSNLNVRPSRSHFKIYIIDEVHMLTLAAFNALLKTLEEPPEHVKFVFCTTDPEKIPITVLSRCQRFDFAPVATDAIADRLRLIVQTEGVPAEEAALQLLARRAGGSLRDSQSLLEQLLSFSSEGITEQAVHQMLGTAQMGRLTSLAQHLMQRDAAAALTELDAAVSEGVDIGQLIEQLLGYFRDMLAATVGCSADLMLQVPSSDHAQLRQSGQELGLETLLAATQILDQAIARMRYSFHARALAEIAVIRICQLEQLDELSTWIAQLQLGCTPVAAGTRPVSRPAPIEKKKPDAVTSPPAVDSSSAPAPAPVDQVPPTLATASPVTRVAEPSMGDAPVAPPQGASTSSPTPAQETQEVRHAEQDATPLAGSAPTAVEAERSGRGASSAAEVPSDTESSPREDNSGSSKEPVGEHAEFAGDAESLWRQALERIGGVTRDAGADFQRIAISAPNVLAITFPAAYNKERCERAEVRRKIEQALEEVSGRTFRVEMTVVATEQKPSRKRRAPGQNRARKMREIQEHPLIQETMRVFGAEVTRLDEPSG